jgi:hypothetical protein
MPKYQLEGQVTISVYCEIEADSTEDAEAKVEHHMWETSGEVDGTVELTSVEVIDA